MHYKRRNIGILCIFLLSLFPMTAGNFVIKQNKNDKEEPISIRSGNRELPMTYQEQLVNDPLLLSSNSSCEIILSDPQVTPLAFFRISPLTDLKITGTLDKPKLHCNYGRFRCVSSERQSLSIFAKEMKIEIAPNSDIIYSCTSNRNQRYILNIAVFHGKVSIFDKTTDHLIQEIIPFQMAEIENLQSIHTIPIDKEILTYFQNTNSRQKKHQEIGAGLHPILETLLFKTDKIQQSQMDIPPNYENDEIILFHADKTQQTTTSNHLREAEAKKGAMRGDPFRFSLSFLYRKTEPGLKVGWYPSFFSRDGLFRLVLSFEFAMFPMSREGVNPFMKLNDLHSEWFIEHIQGQDTIPEKVLGLLEDAFLKIRRLYYGNETTNIQFQFGLLPGKEDKNNLQYFKYTPSLVLPYFRSSSLDVSFRNIYSYWNIYMENVFTGGLIGFDMQFFSPYQSFQFRIGLSSTLDSYPFRKNIRNNFSQEGIFPINEQLSLFFTVFDLPSFGYELYLNAGILLPLSFQMEGNTPLFAMNPSNLQNTLNFNIGQKFRGKNLTFSLELLFHSEYHRPALYSPLYFFTRESYFELLHNNKNSSNYYAGARFGLLYRLNQSVDYKMYYRPAVYFRNLFQSSSSQLTEDLTKGDYFPYRDHLLLGLTISPEKKHPFSAEFTLAFEWNTPIKSIFESTTTQNYHLLFQQMAAHVNLNFQILSIVNPGATFSLIPASETGLPNFRGEVYLNFHIDFLKEKTKSDLSDPQTEKRQRR